MTETEAINFYTGLIKLAPNLQEMTENLAISRCGKCYETIFGISPTREHIRTALAKFKTGGIKRAWTLKFRYLVHLFLVKPDLSIKDATLIVGQRFNQRTRASVVESALLESKNFTPEAAKDFIAKVTQDYQKVSKDLTLI